MVENIRKKVFWIVGLLLASVLCMVLPPEPFRLGLDLQGGTRLVYSIDFDAALRNGEISAEEASNRGQLLQDTLDIIRERVDPNGVLEASFRAQGTEEFVIEIPRVANLAAVDASAPLKSQVLPGDTTLSLDLDPKAEMLRGFSMGGGQVGIGKENIRYGYRADTVLYDLQRGFGGTQAIEHAAGEIVTLLSDDPIRSAIENPGALQFYIGAELGDFSAAGTTLEAERQKVQGWIAANPGSSIGLYNRLDYPQGAPDGILWFPNRLEGEATPESNPIQNRLAPLLLPQEAEWSFDSGDLKNVNKAQDDYGYPAVGLEMTPSASGRFGDFTKAHQKRLLGVVVNEVIATLATINEPLYGRYQISGGDRGFTDSEVNAMVKVLRSGSLKIKPKFKEEERIGASLGDEYVRRGAMSAIVGLICVVAFTVMYYRRLGVYAALSLVCNIALLLGAMAFLRATLTLPGVAGIVLTVGMAVDANILIYERIREETKRGRKLAQAAKQGFERAAVTIIDSNLTTFLTAAILWNFGTGPVRGFATTLMIGIITTMFAALVVTRVLVSFALLRGITEFKMGEWVKETKIPFMRMAKQTITASVVVIVAGLALFAALPTNDKFSIDFLGGFSVTVRTQEPQSVDTIRGRIQGIAGDVGSAEVIALLESGAANEGYRAFRVTYKGGAADEAGADGAEAGAEKTGEKEIRTALEDLVQEGPVVVAIDPAGDAATGRVYFEDTHPEADVATVLDKAGLTGVVVTADASRTAVYSFTGTAEPGTDSVLLNSEIGKLFTDPSNRDSANREFRLANPVPEAAVVGAQVVGELRDKAIAAILLSLFAIVMYIRVRFAEYSYGIAAVVALIHDVLVTLGALAVADYFGFIDGEINLSMIAAFLTIIGFSINDTIVIFDRVRENRPRMKGTLSEILDISINQTLSRTILTSGTVFIAVIVLLVFNYGGESVLEGFSYAMLIGVLAGTYSTVFIACPIFLWLENHAARKRDAESSTPAPPSQVSTSAS